VTFDRPPGAVLFDRDGTLVVDVPYCGDPEAVTPVPTAGAALALLRAAGIPVGVVTNQSGIARGLLGAEQVDAVNRRVDDLLGPFDVWQQCPHGPGDGCTCRKPAPGMVLAAALRLGVAPEDVAVVGDIGADVGAALAAGARPVLVPTPVTRPEEVAAAPVVRPDLLAAVRHLLGAEERDAVDAPTPRPADPALAAAPRAEAP
jgi:HAD superfamily hydrolase (TIGR01662 family)